MTGSNADSHLQACGIINDHDADCPRRKYLIEHYPTVEKRRYGEKGGAAVLNEKESPNKKNKLPGLLFSIAAVLFYISAIIAFAGSHDAAMGATWLCIGTVFLVLGANQVGKKK